LYGSKRLQSNEEIAKKQKGTKKKGTGIGTLSHNEGTFVCDREAGSGSGDSFTITGLENSTKYNFSAFTYDEAGNYSETAHVSTTPTQDPTPPTPPTGLEIVEP